MPVDSGIYSSIWFLFSSLSLLPKFFSFYSSNKFLRVDNNPVVVIKDQACLHRRSLRRKIRVTGNVFSK